MNWRELRQRFLDHILHRHYSAGTVQSYATWLERLSDFGQSQGLSPADVSKEHAEMWRFHLQTLRYSDSSRMQCLNMVRSFYRWAVSERLVLQNPFGHLVLGRVHRPERICPTPEQMDALLTLPDATTVLGLRDATLMALLYGAGVRLSECIWTDVDDVDLKGAVVYVRQAKGGTARMLPLGKNLLAQLTHWLRAGRPPLHRKPAQPALLLSRDGDRMGKTRIEQIVRAYGRQAGLGRVTPHLLRHAFGSHLLEGGADVCSVQQLLGHKSLHATQTYTHLSPEQLAEHLRRTHPRHAPKPKPPDILS